LKARSIQLALRILGPCLCIGLFVASALLIYRITLRSPDKLQWSRYGFADLLINYNAGFLRRGLLGTLIQTLAHGGPALPITDLILFANFVLLLSLISILALTFKTARYKIWNIVLLLAIPGGAFAMGVSREFFYRKEIFFQTALAITALAVSLLPRVSNRAARRLLTSCIFAAIFILGVALILVHEGFLFLSAPANFFLIMAAARTIESPISAEPKKTLPSRLGLAYIGFMVLVFLALLPFHGGAKASIEIWNGLNPSDRTMLGPFNLSAIGWMSHSFAQLVSEPVAVLISGMAWFWLVPIAGLMLFSLALVAINLDPEASLEARDESFQRWVLCYLTLLACSVPIFFIGRDWGRWIDSVNLSFLILWLSIPPPTLNPFRSANHTLAARLAHLSRTYAEFIQGHKPAAIAVMLLFALTFRFPESILEPSDPRYILYLGGHTLWTLLHARLRPH
jgi:hypothetical protein